MAVDIEQVTSREIAEAFADSCESLSSCEAADEVSLLLEDCEEP